jgi:prolipoprotein diacylglyceryltransferase
LGCWHWVIVASGPGTWQQISPALQHSVLQQNWLDEQAGPPPLHGGTPQVPTLQKGCVPSHFLPHDPQFLMSFCRFTQAPSQHPNPGMLQAAEVQVPPELLVLVDELVLDEPVLVDELLVEEAELVDELEVLPDPVVVGWVLVVVPWPPAPPVPTVKSLPQPARTRVPIPKAKDVLMVTSSPSAGAMTRLPAGHDPRSRTGSLEHLVPRRDLTPEPVAERNGRRCTRSSSSSTASPSTRTEPPWRWRWRAPRSSSGSWRSVRVSLRETSWRTGPYCAGVVGARVLYVIVNLHEYDTLAAMTSMRRGGLLGYGGFLGGAAFVYLLARSQRIPFLAVADLTVPCLAVLTAVTRVGCYAFGCDFGVPLSAGAPGWLKALGTFPHWPEGTIPHGAGAPAWMQHVMERGLSPQSPVSLPVHPTQLYEVILGALFLGGYFVARRHQRFRGQIFFQFVLAYGACRFGLDLLRDDMERGSVGPLLPEHILIPAGLALFAAAYAWWVAPAVEAASVRRVTQAAAFAPALVALARLRPRASTEAEAMMLSTTQFVALATGLAAACGFAVVRRRALADPAGAMAIALPAAGPGQPADQEPRPVRKKKKRRNAKADP